MIHVLACDSTSESGRKLAEALGGRYHNTREMVRCGPRDIMIRWGNSAGRDHEFTLNLGEAIRLNKAKHEALNVLSEIVPTPKLYLRRIPSGKKAVIRAYEHSGGAGFRVVEGPSVIPDGHFGSEFIDTPHEFRVWFSGANYRCAKRVSIRREDTGVCRSGWGYEVQEVTFNRKEVTRKAAEAIGLDMGAADILWVPQTGQYVVLELNSAPSLDTPGVLQFMVNGIQQMIRSKFPNLTERRVSERRGRERRAAWPTTR